MSNHFIVYGDDRMARIDDKLVRAGAEHAISPNITGALRIASVPLRPLVVDSLDVATKRLRDGVRGTTA